MSFLQSRRRPGGNEEAFRVLENDASFRVNVLIKKTKTFRWRVAGDTVVSAVLLRVEIKLGCVWNQNETIWHRWPVCVLSRVLLDSTFYFLHLFVSCVLMPLRVVCCWMISCHIYLSVRCFYVWLSPAATSSYSRCRTHWKGKTMKVSKLKCFYSPFKNAQINYRKFRIKARTWIHAAGFFIS